MEENYYSKKDIINSLLGIGLKQGDSIFIHSNIGLFGLLENAENKQQYYTIFKEAIFEVIGESGTIINPTFSYSFCKGENFDVIKTPSNCGILSNLALNDKNAIRSLDPNFSIVSVGKYASFFTEITSNYSFGENSFWEKFLEKEGKILFFNIPNVFPTFAHFLEFQNKVPYRYDKGFLGEIILPNESYKTTFFHYVYDQNIPENQTSIEKFTDLAYSNKFVKTVDLGRGDIKLITAKDVKKLFDKEYLANQSFMVKGETYKKDIKPILNKLFDDLFPINRSLTGNNNRLSLSILSEIIDLKIKEIPSGTKCFDWEVPEEWNVNEAWIKDEKGNKIIDFKLNNLHLLGYSEPIHKTISFETLKEHLYTEPAQPNVIPYRTSYYKKRWGFCISHNQFLKLDQNSNYEIFIDSNFNKEGSMTIGEAIIEGESKKEIIFSTYICHPSMANNELSGPLVTAMIYQNLKKIKNLKYTYRFLFIPETIGSIYSLHERGVYWKENLYAGFVVTCAGDKGKYTYKRSRIGDSLVDRATELILKQSNQDYQIINFTPAEGSDERQFCSPGFNLPVGSLMRTRYRHYPEYHTSDDNKDIICFESMEKIINIYTEIIKCIEKNEVYINTNPFCEPQLGKRNLYPTIGSQVNLGNFVETMMWVLNLADGSNDLIAISAKSNLKLSDIYNVIDILIEKELLIKIN
jgi:aminopeptidase-like protein/aminoglycoside N3'-acetyltransferase